MHRIDCLLTGKGGIGSLALENCGYTARPGMLFFEKLEPVGPGNVGVLEQHGARMVLAGT